MQPVAGAQEEVNPEIDFFAGQTVEAAQQEVTLLHGNVVRLVLKASRLIHGAIGGGKAASQPVQHGMKRLYGVMTESLAIIDGFRDNPVERAADELTGSLLTSC